jgi:hypothetical protein
MHIFVLIHREWTRIDGLQLTTTIMKRRVRDVHIVKIELRQKSSVVCKKIRS